MAPHSYQDILPQVSLATDGEIPNLPPKANASTLNIPKDSPISGDYQELDHMDKALEEFAARISLNTEYAYTPRKLRVITIGAGFSGLLIAHKFEHRFPELKDLIDHTVLEARGDVGGTW